MKFRIIEKPKIKNIDIDNKDNLQKYPPLIVFEDENKKQKNISYYSRFNWWQKIILYFVFELNSAFTQQVSEKIFNTRKNLCLTCPGLAKSSEDPIGYCKLCGCGKNPRARLTVKLTVAGATCPRNLWRPVRGKFSVKNFMKSLLGISQTVWYNLKQLCKSKKHN